MHDWSDRRCGPRTGHSLADRVSSANFEWLTTGMPLVKEIRRVSTPGHAFGAHRRQSCRTWFTLIINDLRVSRARSTAVSQGLWGCRACRARRASRFLDMPGPVDGQTGWATVETLDRVETLTGYGGTGRADLLLPNARVLTPCRLCSSCFVVESKIVCGGVESSVRLTASRMTLFWGALGALGALEAWQAWRA